MQLHMQLFLRLSAFVCRHHS